MILPRRTGYQNGAMQLYDLEEVRAWRMGYTVWHDNSLDARRGLHLRLDLPWLKM